MQGYALWMPFLKSNEIKLLIFILLFSALPLQWADDNTALPRIQRLDNRDSAFLRYLSDVELSRQRISSPRGISSESLAESLKIYTYAPGVQDDFN